MKKHFVGGMVGLAITVSGAGSFATAQDKPSETAEVSEMSEEEDLLVAQAQDDLDAECTLDLCLQSPCSKHLDEVDDEYAALLEPWATLSWESYMRLYELCEKTPGKSIGELLDALPTEVEKIEKKEEKTSG